MRSFECDGATEAFSLARGWAFLGAPVACVASDGGGVAADGWDGANRVKVWALDRMSFKKLLSQAAFARRKRYAKALQSVELLKALTPYKKLQVRLLHIRREPISACVANARTLGRFQRSQ